MKNGISVSDNLQRLRGDTDGTAFLEFTIFAGVFFTLLFGIVEFSLAFYQWNAGTKAVQVGARLAAVSSPIAPSLGTLTGMEDGALPGSFTVPDYEYVCQGTSETAGTCNGDAGDYDVSAMNTLVYGRGNNECTNSANIGMCNLFRRVTPTNVIVTYKYTGLGYAGRPGGPVPTIRVELVDIPMQFFFFDGLFGLNDLDIPGLASTVTGEDLSLAGS